ncbi:hypothetical protein CF335_g9152 [Tilletia laevis]|nr:hypothetical protein CF335_g9152 [Tilletia laevis]
MPPKETTPALTRGKQRQQGAESDAPTDIPAAAVASPSEAPVVEKTIGQQLREIIDGQTTLMARVESLQQSHDEISTRIDRVKVASPRSSTPRPSSAAVSAAPAPSSTSAAQETSTSTSMGSDPSSDQSASSASRSGPPLPVTMQDLLASMSPTDQSEFRSLLGKYNSSVTKLSAAGDSIQSVRSVATVGGTRSLTCKKDSLGEFDGDPSKLERFLSKLRDIARSNPDPLWEPAVVCTLPQCLTGDAETWHIGLSNTAAAELCTVADWVRVMRLRFRVNKTDQRQQARLRVWNARSERAMTYYFDKIQLYRQAFGDLFAEASIAQEVIAGLPASMRAMLRLPQDGVSPEDVQDALSDWEPTWREVSNTPLIIPSSAGQSGTSVPLAPSLTAPAPVRPPRSDLRHPPAPTRPASQSSSGDNRFDPSRVIEATATEKRGYRRNNGSIMRLNRPCGQCGESHFDFEHVWLKEGARAFPLVAVGEYDVELPEIDNGQSFA